MKYCQNCGKKITEHDLVYCSKCGASIRNGKKPIFCIKKETIKYGDGETDICIGPMYKVYEYRRTELKGSEFVSIFAKEKQPEVKETIEE